MDDAITRGEIDAKLAAVEARTDAKFAGVIARLDLISVTLAEMRADNRSTKSTVITTVVGAAIALFLGLGAIIVGVAVGLPSIYSMGAEMREVVRDEVKAQMPAPAVTPPH